MKIGFLGFGLIGGSIARSLKSKDESIIIQVYARSKSKELNNGLTEGIIDFLLFKIDSAFSDCDIIFLCAPTLTNISFLKKIKPIIRKGCILTDVGSVKGNIHQEVIRLKMEDCFIGGHPMAGSEKTGFANSSVTLLENAYYLLTPTKKTTAKQLQTMKDLIERIGSV
ncbi:MAG: prephenate dehydrogenase/arogenate dehydrogenase family protein, partial [Lachnoclostridium sp.]|nr:prephenate dehydrogenase/arogenate dehydrogenase family protein [Lachnoclostridium sp.]